ncbi:MAG: hypothetical protein ACKO5W_09470 [Crocinitomicaceae bacterium]
MKKPLIFGVLAFGLNAFGQVPYYSLHDDCETNIDKCWKLGLCWDEDLMDYSTIHESEMLLTYFPKKNSQCTENATYRLTPSGESGEFALWQYKNINISIQVRMQLVETGFGYDLYDVRITNSLVNDCHPIGFTWKY